MEKDLKENMKLLLSRVRDSKVGLDRRHTFHSCEACEKEPSLGALQHRKSRLQLLFGKRVSFPDLFAMFVLLVLFPEFYSHPW